MRYMRDGLETAGTLPVYRMECGRVGEPRVIEGHATCLRETKFCQNIANHSIIYISWLDFSTLNSGFHRLLSLASVDTQSLRFPSPASGYPLGEHLCILL